MQGFRQGGVGAADEVEQRGLRGPSPPAGELGAAGGDFERAEGEDEGEQLARIAGLVD